ncbi:hypothetical protein [Rhodanobacter sp. FW106-PBR-R2A-1-13]|uniref:hypothetical protein n=1 Tax=Rhodanobacter sp. FW106-PBR-R2A-1-13 TaxID=3454845 RepID=UPI0034E5F81C
MTHAATQDRWVSVQIAPPEVFNYRTGTLSDLAGVPAPGGSRVAMRLLHRADALTDSLIDQFRSLANTVVARSIHSASRKVVAGYWDAKSDTSLYFLIQPDHRLSVVPFDDAKNLTKAWDKLLNTRQTPHDADWLVEFLRNDPLVPLDEAWAELRGTLDLVLTPEPPPPIQTSASEPTVTIQTAPGEARRLAQLMLVWPTSTEVGQRAGSSAINAGQWARDARDAGRLFGVWDQALRTFRHPTFQFAADGTLKAEVRTLLAAMAEHPDWTRTEDANGWRRAYWLYQPFRSLSRRALDFAAAHPSGQGNALHDSPGGALDMIDHWLGHGAPEDSLARTPAEVFAENPQAVINFAQRTAAAASPDTDVEGLPLGY